MSTTLRERAIEYFRDLQDRIVAALEAGCVPWRRPWSINRASGRHANATTKRAYSGINPLVLELHAQAHDLISRFWGTYRQWEALGCRIKQRPKHVQAGQWSAKIVFFKPVQTQVVDAETGEESKGSFCVMKWFNVFNADQVEGDAAAQFQAVQPIGQIDVEPDFEPAERLVQATGAVIEHGGNEAFYSFPLTWPHHKSGDYIRVPHKHQFSTLGTYYETLFHELAHWSEPRLGVDFSKRDYAACELVAEMSACFLATDLGIPQGEPLDNHAAYLKSWLEKMKGDSSFIFKASTQASKTTDFLLSFVRPAEQVEAQPVQTE